MPYSSSWVERFVQLIYMSTVTSHCGQATSRSLICLPLVHYLEIRLGLRNTLNPRHSTAKQSIAQIQPMLTLKKIFIHLCLHVPGVEHINKAQANLDCSHRLLWQC